MDEVLRCETLERPVEGTDGDVGADLDVILLGELAQLVAMHLAAVLELGEDVQTDTRHVTPLG